MKCIWCDLETTSNKTLISETIKEADKEHIFPECVGGKKTLDVGKVCKSCNNGFSQIDNYLQTENFMMLKQFQDSSKIIGKPLGKNRGKKDRERKVAKIIKAEGYSGGSRIERDINNFNNIKLINLPDGSGGDVTYNDKFSKALHKCAVNVLLNKYDYEYLKKHFSELIDFVNNEQNFEFTKWSYGSCYSGFFSRHFEPFCLQMIEIDKIPNAVVLIFPCAIFIVCTKPNIMDIDLLKIVGSNPPKLENWEQEKFDYLKHFANGIESSRKSFGSKLQFTLIKKEIIGKPNSNDSFYLLTKCKTCGQTNPTGIMLSKKMVLGKTNGLGSGNKNSWNFHSKEDLEILCPNIEISESFVKDFELKYGINYPPENDVKKMNISNCKVQCINCSVLIIYDAKDCFV